MHGDNSDLPVPTSVLPIRYSTCPHELLCTTSEVLTYIKSLDVNKASGPDGISVRMLKSTARTFNISIRLGRFPESWKTSAVVPILKSSNHKDASNYRPISLLPVTSKILERHLHQQILQHLNASIPLSNRQWGFQAGKSTVTALLSVTFEWFNSLEMGQDICAIFFDLRKTFDSVPHQPLLEKLCSYNLDPHILSWISSYLTGRKQHVVVDGESSPDTHVLSGVPQGSVLLFLIYIDDISLINLSEGSMLNLFADDMLLYKPINSTSDFHHLQLDIEQISDWVSGNNLTLNPIKCKSMVISIKKEEP